MGEIGFVRIQFKRIRKAGIPAIKGSLKGLPALAAGKAPVAIVEISEQTGGKKGADFKSNR